MQPRRRTAGGTDGYEAVETRSICPACINVRY
jgi:hypothetical protein